MMAGAPNVQQRGNTNHNDIVLSDVREEALNDLLSQLSPCLKHMRLHILRLDGVEVDVLYAVCDWP
jgi:hypothetical protein